MGASNHCYFSTVDVCTANNNDAKLKQYILHNHEIVVSFWESTNTWQWLLLLANFISFLPPEHCWENQGDHIKPSRPKSNRSRLLREFLIERRSGTSRYHGNKMSGSQQKIPQHRRQRKRHLKGDFAFLETSDRLSELAHHVYRRRGTLLELNSKGKVWKGKEKFAVVCARGR